MANVEAYSRGYQMGYDAALKAIGINLEHFSKTVYEIKLVYDGCDVDTFEGEYECMKLLKSCILGVDDEESQ